MLNDQDFFQLKWRNDIRSLAVKDHGISERAENDVDRQINDLKCSRYDYFDHDQTDIHVQIVPEIHKEEEKWKQNLMAIVPDEHSETGEHHDQIKDNSDKRCHNLRNKHKKQKRRRIQILSDDESDGFTREVPSMSRKGTKRRRRRNDMSDKIRTLRQLVPHCYNKMDKVSVLDKAIDYMKTLQLQLQVMSVMGMNSYFPPATTLDFGMYNHLSTAMAVTQGLNLQNQTTSSLLLPPSNWLLPPFTATPLASSPECLYGLVPSLGDFYVTHTMGRL